MANKIWKGAGKVATTDTHKVELKGTTKGGKAVTIRLPKALNMGNIDLEFKEKDDVVAQVVFTALYDNTDEPATTTEEPFEIEVEDGLTAGAGEIITGAGALYIDDVLVGLTRGGFTFSVEREFRNINADGDRGPVDGRVMLEGSTATLTLNVLQVLTNLGKLFGLH